MKTSFSILGIPVPKPRMTQADRWKKRDCVERYRAWCDLCRLEATGNPSARIAFPVFGIMAFFHLPVPESYSNTKKALLAGTLHDQKPDSDNLCKGLLDALFSEDKAVACIQAIKLWCVEGEEPRTDVFLFVR